MLTLDLVRHGPALPTSSIGDAGRPLSPEGRRLIERLAERLSKDGWNPLPGYVSPLLRARQTAEILAAAVPAGLPLIVVPELHPDGDAAGVIAVLEPLLESGSHTVLVGHQPMLGDLIQRLAGETLGPGAGTLIRLVLPERLAAGAARVALTLQPPNYT